MGRYEFVFLFFVYIICVKFLSLRIIFMKVEMVWLFQKQIIRLFEIADSTVNDCRKNIRMMFFYW